MSEPVGWLRSVVYDAEDIAHLASFWQAVLGVDVAETQDGWLQLWPARGDTFVAFQARDEKDREAGDAAATTPGIRMRPDIEVEDMDVAQARIEELGGRLVKVIHASPTESHYRMADPEGNEFTLVLPLPPELRTTDG